MLTLIASLIKFFGDLFNTVFKWWLSQDRKNGDSVAENIRRNDFIYQKLQDILATSKCDRVFIFQFHNGGNFYTGQPIQKCSCTYEVVANGIASANKDMLNILVSSYHSFLYDLVLKGAVYYNTMECVQDQILKDFLSRNGVKSEFCWAIRNLNGNIIGFLGIHYVKEQQVNITDEVEATFIECANSISGYLYKEVYLEDIKNNFLSKFKQISRTFLYSLLFVLLILIVVDQGYHLVGHFVDAVKKY